MTTKKTKSGQGSEMACFWSPDKADLGKDTTIAFRASFELSSDTELEFRLSGASWFQIFLDGDFLAEGPARYNEAYPEYDRLKRTLSRGVHVIAAKVNHTGDSTRLLKDIHPFLLCEALHDGKSIGIDWKCIKVPGYTQALRRVNGILGWIEWLDCRNTLPAEWDKVDFDDSNWKRPARVYPFESRHPDWKFAEGSETFLAKIPLKLMDSGRLSEEFGYETDDPPLRFFVRDLKPSRVPPQGIWKRYDLGKTRLMHPDFVIDLPRDTVIEFAYSESLYNGRVTPWINLTGSPSANMDHFVSRGGVEHFTTLCPRGGRFLELHIITENPEAVKFIEEYCLERCHYGDQEGSFHCGRPALEKIWTMGVETLKACAEDTIVDTPVRERGTWTGDSLSVVQEIAGYSYKDLSIFRRIILMSAHAAREDGLVAGLCSGTLSYLSTFAAQWISAVVRFVELTGDKSLLAELLPAATRNLKAFSDRFSEEGLDDSLGWGFIDWGYIPNSGSDMAVNLHYLAAVRDMRRWLSMIDEDGSEYEETEGRILRVIKKWIESQKKNGKIDFDSVGYHRATLLLRMKLLEAGEIPQAIALIEKQWLESFPNDPSAPRLSSPSVKSTRLVTPYFAHFALQELAEHGEMDFVLRQFETAWGWMISSGFTTCAEVFDHRWSHSHAWSGCPTWQLSCYALGLKRRFDIAPGTYDFMLRPGNLEKADGSLPESIKISWTRDGKSIAYQITSSKPITLLMKADRITVQGCAELRLKEDQNGSWQPI